MTIIMMTMAAIVIPMAAVVMMTMQRFQNQR